MFTGGQGQKSQRGVRFPFLRRGVNFSNQRGVTPLNPKKIASRGFLVLTHSVHHRQPQKKVPLFSDPGKGANLHNFKMAAKNIFNVQETLYWCILAPINVLPTDINMVPKCQISKLEMPYDVIMTSK